MSTTSSSSLEDDPAPPVPFHKILYGPRTHPTNYVPPDFLSSLRRNVNVRPHTYSNLLYHALPLTGSIAALALFVTLFGLLLTRQLAPSALVLGCLGVYVAGWVWFEWLGPSGERSKAIKSSLLVTLSLLSLSPILRTLSRSTSSDTIYALSVFLFLLSLLLYPSPYKTAGHIATTTSISSSLVLASRLSGSQDVFALLLLAVLSFSLLPIFITRLRDTHRPTYVGFVGTLALLPLPFIADIPLLRPTPTSLMLAYALILCLVTFGGPAALLYAQRYKNEIRGPWDPAVPVIRRPRFPR